MFDLKNTEWLTLKFEPSELVLKAKIRDETVDVMMSPYDVPEAIRMRQLKEDGWYAIEFRYLSNDEEKAVVAVSDLSRYVTGKSSARLYEMRFHEDLLKGIVPSKLNWAEIDHHIKEIVDRQRDHKKESSYELVRKAFERSFESMARI